MFLRLHRSIKLLGVLLLVVFIYMSCRKELDIQKYHDCDRSMGLDSSGIRQRLVGTWRWIKYTAGDQPDVHKAERFVKVTFEQAGVYEIFDGDVISSGTWSLHNSGNFGYQMTVSPDPGYFSGQIFHCGNEVVFYDGYRDGVTNVFRKE